MKISCWLTPPFQILFETKIFSPTFPIFSKLVKIPKLSVFFFKVTHLSTNHSQMVLNVVQSHYTVDSINILLHKTCPPSLNKQLPSLAFLNISFQNHHTIHQHLRFTFSLNHNLNHDKTIMDILSIHIHCSFVQIP